MVAAQLAPTCLPADHTSGGRGGGHGGGGRVIRDSRKSPCCLEKFVVELWARLEGMLEGIRAHAVVRLGLMWVAEGGGGGGADDDDDGGNKTC